MHYSVLLNESLDLLAIKPDGIYIDGTFGRGGHSRAILERLSAKGRLIAFDKDPEAIAYAKTQVIDERFQMVHASFASMAEYFASNSIVTVDGILLDLGVSSPQLDTPDRGFSFRFDAPLDMRMNNSSGMSASEWVNSADQAELADVFWRYGEEKFSRRIARAIVEERSRAAITTTSQLADLVAKVIPIREKGQHPATRVFQATRIHINNELGDLEHVLNTAPEFLSEGGRMVVISFHSLEDRIVKTQFNTRSQAPKLPKWVNLPLAAPEFKVVAKKVRASNQELANNARSRSAVMRALERISVTRN